MTVRTRLDSVPSHESQRESGEKESADNQEHRNQTRHWALHVRRL